METIILFCGLFNVGLVIFHLAFWKLLHWDQQLLKLSITNKAVMQIFNIQLIYYFIFTAGICFAFPAELLSTELGKWFLIGTSLFWFVRVIQQFVFLRANKLWVHILTIVFLIGAILFALPVILK